MISTQHPFPAYTLPLHLTGHDYVLNHYEKMNFLGCIIMYELVATLAIKLEHYLTLVETSVINVLVGFSPFFPSRISSSSSSTHVSASTRTRKSEPSDHKSHHA